ncbi:hypothetical protein D5S18_24905 [Nocardia panacis]|uniref:Uncharacterized protein n=1 Tax=Nocardia panacis TaxID=2340916 RepID=A0A3A4KEA7_9NOCA|nr:hypothetical protein [Nocardia panacis]RJO71414.1 hypothetical protein D5S18_24905 [Nocardia panacis]
MSRAGYRFADGRPASDDEMECVAVAFGFAGIDHLRRVMLAADARRAGASPAAAERIAAKAAREIELAEFSLRAEPVRRRSQQRRTAV